MAKKADPTKSSNNRVVATNRKARHNYSILETFEAGVALMGTEVKSLRDGQASLADAFATVDDGEIWLRNLHIPEYHHGSWTNHTPRRNRKLLLHRSQIDTLIGKIRDGNLTLVPLSLYFSDGKVKVELALARGKQAHDKRQDIAKRDAQREVAREMGRRIKGQDLIGVVFALASALGYGISDFVGGIASRRVAALRVVLVSYPVALALLLVLALIVGGDISHGAMIWGGLCGFSQAFGIWWFYAALGSGPISVVSPLTAILVAAIPVGVGLALGERPGAIAGVGVVLALVAVVLVSRETTRQGRHPAPLHHEGRLADGGCGRRVRVELRLDRAGAARSEPVAVGVRAVGRHPGGGQHRGGERQSRRAERATAAAGAAGRGAGRRAPTSRCSLRCTHRCCRWPVCSCRCIRRPRCCSRSWCCGSG